MNYTNDSTYLVANFYSSAKEYYPDNVADNFRVKINKPLKLAPGLWKVALSEICVKNLLLDVGLRTISNNPIWLQIDFEACEGLVIHGNSSQTLRLIPFSTNIHTIYTLPFYVPILTGYIENCHISVKVLSNKPANIRASDKSCITCTLHFKKFSSVRQL